MRFFYTFLSALVLALLVDTQSLSAQPLASGAFAPGESLTYTISFRGAYRPVR